MTYRDSHHKALADYPHPSVAVDTAVLTVPPGGPLSVVLVHDPELEARLRAFGAEPGEARVGAGEASADAGISDAVGWVLPGTFLHEGERLADAVDRSLRQKAGIRGLSPQQLHVFDDPKRDERGWVLSVAHVVVVPAEALATLASSAEVISVDRALRMRLAFDHADIIERAQEFVRSEHEASADPFALLPEPFTLRDLQRLHEAVAGHELPRDTFRRNKIGQLAETGELARGVVGKPARSFVRQRQGPRG